jgi:hypothetical protein
MAETPQFLTAIQYNNHLLNTGTFLHRTANLNLFILETETKFGQNSKIIIIGKIQSPIQSSLKDRYVVGKIARQPSRNKVFLFKNYVIVIN